jgi:hypothetical protein
MLLFVAPYQASGLVSHYSSELKHSASLLIETVVKLSRFQLATPDGYRNTKHIDEKVQFISY